MTTKGNEMKGLNENLGKSPNFFVVRNWDGTIESLRQNSGLESLVEQMGFQLDILVQTLNREFPEDIIPKEEFNADGQKTESVLIQQMNVNDRPLERRLPTLYPPAANPNPDNMTQFKQGGEVIWVKQSEAELTYASKVSGRKIMYTDLIPIKVNQGDLIISTNTPNNWTKIPQEGFSFIYFVGNPGGDQVYSAVAKDKIPVVNEG